MRFLTSNTPGTIEGSVMKLPLAGGATVTLAAHRWQPSRAAVAGSKIVWLDAYLDFKVLALETDPCRRGVCR